MTAITSETKNKTLIQLLRVVLLLALVLYIVFRIMYFLGFFMEEINCGAEKVVSKETKEFLISDNGYQFDNANGRTDEKQFEGKYSVKLTPDNAFGMSITFDVPKGGEEFEASVWCFENVTSTDTSGWAFIVATVGKDFWKGEINVSERKNGWAKLKLKIIVPAANYNDPVVIYCWNSTQNAVYFDNMTIKRKNYWKFFKQAN